MSDTKRVRINLSALTRMEWSQVVEVPVNITDTQLQDVVARFYDEIDGTEFTDDLDFFEKGESCYADEEHITGEEHIEYRVDEDLNIERIPVKPHAVYVHDRRLVKYVVDALNPEQAKQLVEQSDDADEEFGGTTKDGEWYVDNVEAC